jgi:hypothetical protein
MAQLSILLCDFRFYLFNGFARSYWFFLIPIHGVDAGDLKLACLMIFNVLFHALRIYTVLFFAPLCQSDRVFPKIRIIPLASHANAELHTHR